tara:strand:- start:273 stop:476 length:204 start_codon:yes stop_codon:yes gene_type:complete
MGGLMSKPKAPKIPEPKPLPPPPTEESAGITAAEDQRKKKALRRGRSSTILSGSTAPETGGTGILGG